MNGAHKPAFPVVDASADISIVADGLSKREYFAARNMQGLIQGFIPIESKYSVNDGYMDLDEMARDAVRAADLLLAELEKPQS